MLMWLGMDWEKITKEHPLSWPQRRLRLFFSGEVRPYGAEGHTGLAVVIVTSRRTKSIRVGVARRAREIPLVPWNRVVKCRVSAPASRLRCTLGGAGALTSCRWRSEEHTSELQSQSNLVCRLLL